MRRVITYKLPTKFLLIFLLTGIHSFGQSNVKSYTLPESKSSGLTQFFFGYKPVFSIEKWKDHGVLFINMNVEGSTAQNMKGGFWYNYRYQGKEYGDQVVGRDVFYPIRIDLLVFHIRVMGPNMNQQLSYYKGWGAKEVGKVPLTAKPEDYTVFIEDLVSVDFLGTGPIEKKIEGLIAAEKQKQAEEIKKKNDAIAAANKAAEDEKGKQAETSKPSSQNNTAKQSQNTTQSNRAQNSSSTSKADDDFWETGKKTASTSATTSSNQGIDRSKLPELFRTSDGKYYHKQGDKIQEVSYDDYMMLKKANAQQKVQTQEKTKLTPEQQQKAVDDIMSKIKADQQRQADFETALTNKTTQLGNAFIMGGNVRKTETALSDNSRLQGNYQSVEQLMADFNQKMANINSMTAELTEQRNAYSNSMADAMYSAPGDAAFNSGAKLIAGFVNQAKEEKERKRAQEQLKQQKEAMLKQIEAQEKLMLTGVRTDLFARFKEGALPVSSTKLDAQTIYYFVYAYDPQQMGNKQATLFVSNVFPISRYSDGTWPFKSSIANDIAKLTPYAEVLHGYYTSLQEAESMRQGMMEIFVKTGGYTKAINYKGKASANTGTGSSSSDFWETGKKTESTEKKEAKKDDFWNN